MGAPYESLVPVRLVAFITKNRFQGTHLRKSFRLREELTMEVLSSKLELIAIEMARLQGAKPGEEQVFLDKDEARLHTALSRWVRFFQARTREDFETLATESAIMTRAVETIATMSEDREARKLADWREFRAKIDEVSHLWVEQDYACKVEEAREEGLEAGRELGLEQGLERGLEQGREHALREVLALTVAQRFGPPTPATTTRLAAVTRAELPAVVAAALSSATLEDVWSRGSVGT